jgi:hypothetical protein
MKIIQRAEIRKGQICIPLGMEGKILSSLEKLQERNLVPMLKFSFVNTRFHNRERFRRIEFFWNKNKLEYMKPEFLNQKFCDYLNDMSET